MRLEPCMPRILKRDLVSRACCVLLLVLCGCRETILHDLDELQANRVLVELARADIEAEKSREGSLWCVSVNSGESVRALAAVEHSRILRRDLGRSVQQSNSLIQSREEREHLHERQLALTLEHTLESLPEVLEARVHLHLRESTSLVTPEQGRQQSASVLLIVQPGNAVERDQVREVVAAAVGMKEEEVSVVAVATTGQRIDENGFSGETTTQAVSGSQHGEVGRTVNKRKVRRLCFVLSVVLGVMLLGLKCRPKERLPKRLISCRDEMSPATSRLQPTSPKGSAAFNGCSSENESRGSPQSIVFGNMGGDSIC